MLVLIGVLYIQQQENSKYCKLSVKKSVQLTKVNIITKILAFLKVFIANLEYAFVYQFS